MAAMKGGHDFFHPLRQADFEYLLEGRPFLVLRGQLIFRSRGEVVITNIRPGQRFTAEGYRELPEGSPYQLINNELIFMPSPFEIHQRVVGNLFLLLSAFVRQHRLGAVRMAPLDVYLDESNVLQPDLLFVSEARRGILDKHVLGAPDFVAEVLSRSTESFDRGAKRELYARHGVREYWIIDPEKREVEVYTREGEAFRLDCLYPYSATAFSKILEGFELEIAQLFEE
jgi:Uma2 family endonuclease